MFPARYGQTCTVELSFKIIIIIIIIIIKQIGAQFLFGMEPYASHKQAARTLKHVHTDFISKARS
jgi:uncharacterized protein YpmB